MGIELTGTETTDMPTSPTSQTPPEPRTSKRKDAVRDDAAEVPAETDQDIDTAGTEADESAVGSALDQAAVERDPRPDRPGTRP